MGIFQKIKEKIFNSKKNNDLIKEELAKKIVNIDSKNKRIDHFYKEESLKTYDQSLQKTKHNMIDKIENVFTSSKVINKEFFDNLFTALISGDVGILMTTKIINLLKSDITKYQIKNIQNIKDLLVDKMFLLYTLNTFLDSDLNLKPNETNIILVSGINGSGKTTTIAKLANLIKKQNYKIILVAADTFRAGAVDQLKKWAREIKTEIIVPNKPNQDPSSVVYQALEFAENIDHPKVIIIDTAGRLQNKTNLMLQLEKIKRTITKKQPTAYLQNLLIIDSILGQNSLFQAQEFNKILSIDGIILTKMDSSSKGGVVFNIKEQLNIPIKFIGVGEKKQDLEEFDLEKFIYNLFKGFINE